MAVFFKSVGVIGGTPKSSMVTTISAAAPQTRYMTLESPVGTAYQVTALKTFKAAIAQVYSSSSNSADSWQLGYGDNAVADGTTVPTTPQYVTAALGFNAATGRWQSVDIYAECPAGKYPFIKTINTSTGMTNRVYILGIEE